MAPGGSLAGLVAVARGLPAGLVPDTPPALGAAAGCLDKSGEVPGRLEATDASGVTGRGPPPMRFTPGRGPRPAPAGRAPAGRGFKPVAAAGFDCATFAAAALGCFLTLALALLREAWSCCVQAALAAWGVPPAGCVGSTLWPPAPPPSWPVGAASAAASAGTGLLGPSPAPAAPTAELLGASGTWGLSALPAAPADWAVAPAAGGPAGCFGEEARGDSAEAAVRPFFTAVWGALCPALACVDAGLALPDTGLGDAGLALPDTGLGDNAGLALPDTGLGDAGLALPDTGLGDAGLALPDTGLGDAGLALPDTGLGGTDLGDDAGLALPDTSLGDDAGLALPDTGLGDAGLALPDTSLGGTDLGDDAGLALPGTGLGDAGLALPDTDLGDDAGLGGTDLGDDAGLGGTDLGDDAGLVGTGLGDDAGLGGTDLGDDAGLVGTGLGDAGIGDAGSSVPGVPLGFVLVGALGFPCGALGLVAAGAAAWEVTRLGAAGGASGRPGGRDMLPEGATAAGRAALKL